ncbi:MAG: V-type ATP synthase subunit K [Desulfurococcales archaeon]|nr:V-type ATP synthase subunit K [Desulfurococcales archaeon]
MAPAATSLPKILLLLAAALTLTAATASAQITDEAVIELSKYIGAGLAVGLAGIGGGYAVGVSGASAISAIVEREEVFGRAILIVVLGEGIAIYGLLIALILLFVI